jgi:PAS domain S-box-containing protein
METGIFAFYRDTFLSGQAGRYDVNYSYDGLDNYFQLSAQRSGEILVVSFTDPSNQPRSAVDVTEINQARKKAEESESRFRNMVEQAPVAITLTRGRDVRIESINSSMLQMMGKKQKEEVLGKKMIEVLPEVEGQAALTAVMRVFETGELAMMEASVRRFKVTIADLTDIARIQKQLEGDSEPVDLTEIVSDTLLNLQVQVNELRPVIERDLEACPTIQFPRKNLKSVAYNLFSNALKYRDPGRTYP